MIIWECDQSCEGCDHGLLEVAVGNCLRMVCGGRSGKFKGRCDDWEESAVRTRRARTLESEGPKSSIPGHGKSKLEVCVAETLQLRESCESKSCRAFLSMIKKLDFIRKGSGKLLNGFQQGVRNQFYFEWESHVFLNLGSGVLFLNLVTYIQDPILVFG